MKKLQLSSSSKDKIKTNLSRMPELNSHVKKLFEEKLIGQENSQTERSIKSGNILTKISAFNG